MIQMSSEFQNLIQQPSRSIRARVMIRNTEFDEDSIIDFKVVETVNPADSFQIGTAAAAKLEITLVDTGTVILDGAEVKPYIGLEVGESIEWIPLGVFVVDDIRIDKYKVELTCFDYMVKLEKPYFSELTYPATLQSVAAEIAQKAGVTFASLITTAEVPELSGYTLREAIGFVAGFIGGFARFNRNGELEVKTYPQSGFNQAITADHYKEFESAEGPFAVGRLTCIAGEDTEGERIVLTSGTSGTDVQFENPLMTQAQLDSLLTLMGDLNYWPCKLTWQGNPVLEAGDSVSVTDTEENFYYTFVMGQEIRFGGGLSASLEAPGKIESAQEFQSAGPLTRTMNRYVAEQALIKLLMADKASIGELEAVEARIDNLTVGSAQIEDLSVTTAKIAHGAITNAKIGSMAVESANIQDAAITTAKIAVGAIATALIEEGAIETAQIADGSITDAKIVTLTANKITSGTIDAAEINVVNLHAANITVGTINGQQITNGAITSEKISNEAITNEKIAPGTITGDKIQSGSIKEAAMNWSMHLLF